ncbi:MAG: amidohydrolase family protein [Cyclobacteriaceae bacterium]|nr:amidohydrolase family protein [Cyclobacteriaceae bacterium]
MKNKIDAHQHFWNYNENEYSWIDNRLGMLKRDFKPENLKEELDDNGFSGSVAIQARQTVEETRWLLSLARQYDFIKTVVGWIDLQSEKIEEHLIEFTGERKFAGVRHVIQDEKDINFMLKKDFLQGISYLQDYGLTYDLLIYPRHLKVANQFVSKFPEMKFVVDHLAKPSIKEGITEPWANDIRILARNGNVFCKLSGMVTEADWAKWKPADFSPYMDVILDAFGPERIMLGSDWPVCLAAGTYRSVVNLVLEYIRRFSADEQQKIVRDTCLSFYSIGAD